MALFKVYYVKPQHFRAMRFEKPLLAELETTHAYLRTVEAEGLEEVYSQSQGEVWSPNGEARELIESKGLGHTSMSVGDVVETPEGKFFTVARMGFEPLA